MGGSGPIVVRAVELDQPRLSLIALEDGTANWDITKKTAEAAPRRRRRSRWRSASGASRSPTRAVALRQPPGEAQGVGRAATTSRSSGDFSQTLVAIQTEGRRRHRERHLRRHPLPQPGAGSALTADVAGRPGQEGLHPQGHRAPAQRPQARRLRLGEHGREEHRASTSPSTRRAPTSGASSRWCRRSTPTTSTR